MVLLDAAHIMMKTHDMHTKKKKLRKQQTI